MKQMTHTLLLLGAISFDTLSANQTSVDVLNANIEKCFEQTTITEQALKRPCNKVIRANFVSLENRAIAFHNRGVINFNMGDIEGAVRDFSRASKLYPELTQAKKLSAQLQKGMN